MSIIDLIKKFLDLFESLFTINDSFNINVVKQYFGTDKKVNREKKTKETKKTKEKKVGCSSGLSPIFCIWLINLYVLTYKALDVIVEICKILS